MGRTLNQKVWEIFKIIMINLPIHDFDANMDFGHKFPRFTSKNQNISKHLN